MMKNYFPVFAFAILSLVLAGCAAATRTSEMSGIVEKYENKEYTTLNKDFGQYMGLTKDEVRARLGDPKKTNPNDQTGIDDWTYFLQKPEILDTNYGIWNTKKKIKYSLLMIRFQDGRVIGSKTGAPEIWVEQKGVVRALVDPPWKLLFTAAFVF